MEKLPSIYVIIPTYDGSLCGNTIRGLSEMELIFNHIGVRYEIRTSEGNSNIDLGRTLLANHFVNDTTYDKVLWIDADVGFTSESVNKLIMSDEEFVCGAYRQKREDKISYAVSVPENTEMHPTKPLASINWCGFGFVLLDRSVYTKMKDYYPNLVYGNNKKGQQEAFYYNSFAENGILWGEDVSFCKLWKDMGNKIWLNYQVDNLTHMGRKYYKPNNLYEDLFTNRNGEL